MYEILKSRLNARYIPLIKALDEPPSDVPFAQVLEVYKEQLKK